MAPPVWETAVHRAVAGDVFDGVFFVLSFFPLHVLNEIWDLIESVSEGFLTYFTDDTELNGLRILICSRKSVVTIARISTCNVIQK